MDKSEDDIDTEEQPEMVDWAGAERGKFYPDARIQHRQAPGGGLLAPAL